MNEKRKNELVKYRISRSKETYAEVQILIKNRLWNTVVNRLYYACYYTAIALLLDKNLKATTHGGVRQMLGLHFIKTNIIDKESGKFYSNLFDLRQSGDYEDFIEFSEEEVMELMEPARKFISEIERLL